MKNQFNRFISDDFINDFIILVDQYLSLKIDRDDVKNAVETFSKIEEVIDGRIAGDVEDYILNYFIRKHVANKFLNEATYNVEIGVLFGGSFSFTINSVLNNDNIKFIGIDPLDGYYIKDEKIGTKIDKYSNKEVSSLTLKRNLDRLNIPTEKYEIIQGYSTDNDVLDRMKCKKISVLFIDGDHTYDGVRQDFELYYDAVVDGGYIIIDNYNDANWLDVKIYCDELLGRLSSKYLIGEPLVFGRSIIFEKGKKLSIQDSFNGESSRRFTEILSKRIISYEDMEQHLKSKVQVLEERVGLLEKYKSNYLLLKSNPMKFIVKKLFS